MKEKYDRDLREMRQDMENRFQQIITRIDTDRLR
jgi:hypothetical protein